MQQRPDVQNYFCFYDKAASTNNYQFNAYTNVSE